MINILQGPGGSSGIDKNQFIQASQMIELNKIQTQLVDEIVKRQVQKNRQKYKYPAIISFAQLHKSATRFGSHPENLHLRELPVCHCCSMRIRKQAIPLCYSTTDTSQIQIDPKADFKLDSGIVMFFSFIKMIIFYLLFRFIITDAFNLYANILQGQTCKASSTECKNLMFNMLSLYNRKEKQNLLFITDILNAIAVILSIIFFRVYRKWQYVLYDTIDQNKQTEDDYTIMVGNIPTLDFPKQSQQSANNVQFFYRKHLQVFFQQKIKDWLQQTTNWTRPEAGTIEYDFDALKHKNNGQLRSKNIIKSISLCYNLSRLQTIQQTRQQLIKQYLQTDHKQKLSEQNNKSRFSSIPQKVDFLNDCQIILNKQFASDNSVLFNMTHFVGIAFISFQYQHYRDYIIQQAQTDKYFMEYNGNKLNVSKASHPSEIFWFNLRISSKARYSRILVSYFILLVVLFFSFFILSAAELYRQKYYPASTQVSIQLTMTNILTILQSFWFSIATAIFVFIVNEALIFIIRKLNKNQKHESKTNETASLVLKLFASQFLNTAIVYFFVSQYFQLSLTSITGLITQVSWLFPLSAIIQIVLAFIFYKDIGRRLSNWWKYRRLQPTDQVQTFQVKLNQQFQYIEFDLSQWYSLFLFQIYLASFYSYLTPIGIPITLIAIFILYWLIKLNLFKRSTFKYTFNFQLSRYILKMFQINIIVFAAGNFIFSYFITKKFNPINLGSLILAGLYTLFVLLAPQKLQRKLIGKQQKCQNQTYDDCKADSKFQQTYWGQNPATNLVNQSDITGKRSVVNPVEKVIYVNPTHYSKVIEEY